MNTLQTIIAIIIALLGYPIGLLIAKLTEEELQEGRKWFKLIIIASVIGVILSVIFTTRETLLFLSAVFVFILLLALASLVKSKQKNKKKSKTKIKK